MEELIPFQQGLLSQLSDKKRYLLQKINWSNRLIGIQGARGNGETISLLQRIKSHLLKDAKIEALYVTLDDLYFLENTVVDLAREFTLKGGTHLFLDEVHKYPRWSRELIYDKHPRLNIVFTSSSMLEIFNGESDLSRRAVTCHLNELSFREFIHFEQNKELPVFSLEEILGNHSEIAEGIRRELPVPVRHFQNYLQYGAYPYYNEGVDVYFDKLMQTLNLIVEKDMNVVENIP